ncbi:MAG: coenzyme F430 synthase, partial [Methanospirillaceae archaeon]|nr:coenzyme F430 synthase [Methanospirillaceae archaeon]
IKKDSSLSCRSLLVAPGVPVNHKNVVCADEIVSIDGNTARYSYKGMEGSVVNPLFALRGYALPLMLAVAAACMLSLSPAPLSGFVPLEGRMKSCEKNGRLYIDNANSGTNRETAIDAVAYARTLAGDDPSILVIGEEAETICDGFPGSDILSVIRSATPFGVVLVHSGEYDDLAPIIAREPGIRVTHEACSLKDGIRIASAIPGNCPIVLAVKTWR